MSPTEPPCVANARLGGRADGRPLAFASHGSKEWLGNSVVERKRWHFWMDSDSVGEASDSQKHLSRQQYSGAQPKKGGEHVD